MTDPTLASLNGRGLLQVGELLPVFRVSSLIRHERQSIQNVSEARGVRTVTVVSQEDLD
jgi:hypothetical protein